MPDIAHAGILVVATDGFEETELTVPQARLIGEAQEGGHAPRQLAA